MTDGTISIIYTTDHFPKEEIELNAEKLDPIEQIALKSILDKILTQSLRGSQSSKHELANEIGETDETTTIEQRLTWTEDQIMALDELITLGSVRENLHSLELWIDSLISKLERTRL